MELSAKKNDSAHGCSRVIYHSGKIITVDPVYGGACKAYCRVRKDTAVKKHSLPDDITICKDGNNLLPAKRIVSAELYSALLYDDYRIHRLAFPEKVTPLLQSFLDRVAHKAYQCIFICSHRLQFFTHI